MVVVIKFDRLAPSVADSTGIFLEFEIKNSN